MLKLPKKTSIGRLVPLSTCRFVPFSFHSSETGLLKKLNGLHLCVLSGISYFPTRDEDSTCGVHILAGNASIDNKSTRITPSRLLFAVRNDEELQNCWLK
ncbi:hypothetical protein L2E82_25915 [Cichorium intybus]|uniref:Uncharacterized protein n=1 Tax=Cichorium intybus TaxID=13427 RepID=A0ACB9E5X7_CICIN|nr:hypothetical protein L2E82_25915 [Cichorium intybus]